MKHPPFSGFLDDEQRRNFLTAGQLHGRGGALAKECGALTKGGGRCRRPPLHGHWRCLMHAGPKAARAHRERQLADVRAGRLAPSIFLKAEARRQANRIQTAWKRDPWLPGSTIDLAEHEADFRKQVGQDGMRLLPPAVLDWLRWRYRRLLVDAAKMDEWRVLLLDELPRRAAAAGDPPSGHEAEVSEELSAGHWTAERPQTGSPRIRGDRRRLKRSKSLHIIGRMPKVSPGEVDDLNDLLFECRGDLAPVIARCTSEHDRLLVAKAYHSLQSGLPGGMQSWMAVLNHLGLIGP